MNKDQKETGKLAAFLTALMLFAGAVGLPAAANAQSENAVNEPQSAVPSPADLSEAFSKVVKSVERTVVSIDAKGQPPTIAGRGRGTDAENDELTEYLRRQLQRRAPSAVGSGFIVDAKGYIITNAHVVDNASKITVRLNSGEEFNAKLVGSDEETDIAVLKIETGSELPAARFGNSDISRVGEWVLAIGSPFGLNRTVTAGIISHTERETPFASPFQRFIQTDAAINRGNSGGPLVNIRGEVIGVNSQIATTTGDYNGVGFALPSNEAANVYEQLVADGKVSRGYLGVLLDSVQAEFAKVYGLDNERGAIITDVRDSDGPAFAAGLKAGDIITQFNGRPVLSAQDLIAKVASTRPGQAVNISYIRDENEELDRRNVTMKLGERPINTRPQASTRRNQPQPEEKQPVKPLGLTVETVTPATLTEFDLGDQKGVIVKEIDPAGFIADVKLANGGDALGEGDMILRINREPVTTKEAFERAAAGLKKGDPVVMHVLQFFPSSRIAQLKLVQFTVQ